MNFLNQISRGFNYFLLWLEEHQIGILTTIAVHLFIISLVLVLKIRTYTEREYSIMIDVSILNTLPEEVPEEPQTEESAQEFVQNLRQEYQIRNIPVNRADEQAIENIEKMVRDIKTEANITDPQQPVDQPDEIVQQEDELLENEARIYDDKFPVDATGERTIYKGATTVSYELRDRRHVWMPAPAYKCQGTGKIVVDIVVNNKGYVLSAVINKAKSDSEDTCMVEAAKRDAERSRFNASASAPAKQQGTITYIFIAQ